ncbi:MAG: VWA domain-containing protein [Alphaproteobacteria bacterium]|nr:VWA domain-containing protein [Alphaproteobacteria bacterium]
MITFAYPWALVLVFAPFLMYHLAPAVKGMHGDALRVPFLKDIARINILSGSLWGYGAKYVGSKVHLWLLYIAWCLLSMAVARPQFVGEPIRINNYGHDILIVTDISVSMLEPDFSYQGQRLDRLTAVKLAAAEFIKQRPNDRIGLILFGTNAYLQAPITYDKQAVIDTLWATDAGMAGRSTAIGDAVGLGLKVLRQNNHNTPKIMILLTDGENNDGSLSMAEVFKLAHEENVKIYTIGVSSENTVINSFFGIKLPQNGELDEQSLQTLASETRGRYYRASDTDKLQQIYREIDKLEPSSNDDQYVQESKELFYYPASLALLIILLIIVIQRRRYK